MKDGFEIREEGLTILQDIKGKMLITADGALLRLDSFTTETRTVSHWYKADRTVIVITQAKFNAYHAMKKFWGVLDGKNALYLIYFSDLPKMRTRFLTVYDGLSMIGVEWRFLDGSVAQIKR